MKKEKRKLSRQFRRNETKEEKEEEELFTFHKRTRWTAIATADKTSGRLSISRNWDLNAINANGATAINCVIERWWIYAESVMVHLSVGVIPTCRPWLVVSRGSSSSSSSSSSSYDKWFERSTRPSILHLAPPTIYQTIEAGKPRSSTRSWCCITREIFRGETTRDTLKTEEEIRLRKLLRQRHCICTSKPFIISPFAKRLLSFLRYTFSFPSSSSSSSFRRSLKLKRSASSLCTAAMLQSCRVASVGRFSRLMIYERGALLVFEKRAGARLSYVYCLPLCAVRI